MNNEHYLIHKDDYISHIDDKVKLYSFVKQLCHHITKMKMTPANEHICKMAKHFYIEADKMFDSWGIPGSYLVFGDESDLAELMENELIAPEDAGYIPCEDECCCDCCGCEDCPCSDDEDDEDEYDEFEIEGWAETVKAINDAIHNFFDGENVTVHIIIE